MSIKYKKIFLILSVMTLAVIALSAVLFSKAKGVRFAGNENGGKTENRKLTEDYRKDMKEVFHKIEEVAQSGDAEKGNLNSIKSKFFELRVPKEHKNLHLALVLAVEKLDSSQSDKQESIRELESIKKENDWLE